MEKSTKTGTKEKMSLCMYMCNNLSYYNNLLEDSRE